MFRKLVISFAAAAGLMSQFALPAEAGIGAGAFAPPASLAETSPIENAQFMWGGRNYCWYNSSLARPGLVLVWSRVVAWDRLGRRCRLA